MTDSIPILTFFNNKGGVGKTSLVYHLAWILSKLDYKVLAVDLDPQANLTAAFLDEETIDLLWNREENSPRANGIYQCVKPLAGVGDILPPKLYRVADCLHLLPGDLALFGFEDHLSEQWPKCLGGDELLRPFRVITAFWSVVQDGARQCEADVILLDVGPSLGAINRSALIASDYVVVPLGADLFSRQGLRNLGPTLRRWRADWKMRHDNWRAPEFALPQGNMRPIGYVVQQHSLRLSRPVQAYDRWVKRMPAEYARHVLNQDATLESSTPGDDPNCIATLKHYRSLIPLGQEARKPIFDLTPADGAIGSHAVAAQDAYQDFKEIAKEILRRMQSDSHAPSSGNSATNFRAKAAPRLNPNTATVSPD